MNLLFGPLRPFDPFEYRQSKKENSDFLKKELKSIPGNLWPIAWENQLSDSQLESKLGELFGNIESQSWEVPNESTQRVMKVLVCTEKSALVLLKRFQLLEKLITVAQHPSDSSNAKLDLCLDLFSKLAGAAIFHPSIDSILEQLHLIPIILKLIKNQVKLIDNEGINEVYVRGLIKVLGNLTEETKKLRKEDNIRMFQKIPMLLGLSIHMILGSKNLEDATLNIVLDFTLSLNQFMQSTWKEEHSKRFADPDLIANLAHIADTALPNKRAQRSAIELMGDVARIHYSVVYPHFQVIMGILKKETKELAGIIMRAVKVFAFLAVNGTYEERLSMLNNGGLIISRYQNSSDPAMEADACMAISSFFEHRDLIIKICTNDQMLLNNMIGSFIDNSKDEALMSSKSTEYVIKHLLVCFIRAITGTENLCFIMMESGVLKANIEMMISRKLSNHTIINCLGFHTAVYTFIPDEFRAYMKRMKQLDAAFTKKMKEEYANDPDTKVSHSVREYFRIVAVHTNYGPEAAKQIRFGMQIQRREHEQERGVFKCEGCDKLNPAKKCSRCKMASYCSRECQTKEWPTHKLVCKPAT